MSVSSSRSGRIAIFFFLALLPAIAFGGTRAITRIVKVPEEDRFLPFAATIHVGDSVTWINNDGDDHRIVTVNRYTTAGHHNLDHLLKGLENNGGQPGKFTLKFTIPGRFVYRCSFHSHLDSEQQPVAPGPKGGIEDAKGNFGTPMMGVITVLPAE